MNDLPSQVAVAPNAGYQESRFNALRHGILSGFAVLPWENRDEYKTLLAALVVEHAPQGPTEEHLVEELTGIIWRKRRLRLAEAAIYREKPRKAATSTVDPERIVCAALLPVAGRHEVKADISQALTATPAETARDLRDLRRDVAGSRKALTVLASGEADAYTRALDVLAEDTCSYWLESLEDRPADGLRYEATPGALDAWIRRHWMEWYEVPIAELEHRDTIKEQAIGSAYATEQLEVTARYEVHLDRKLERTLAMLVRLRELRRPTVSA